MLSIQVAHPYKIEKCEPTICLLCVHQKKKEKKELNQYLQILEGVLASENYDCSNPANIIHYKFYNMGEQFFFLINGISQQINSAHIYE